MIHGVSLKITNGQSAAKFLKQEKGSTTISKESRGKLLEIDSFLNNKEEDIV